MRRESVNLEDTVNLFIKNLKAFYFFMIIGLVIGLIGIFINVKNQKKVILSSKITIKNPLENYQIIDLFSIDNIEISERKIAIQTTKEKITNYYLLTQEYLDLIVNTVDLEKYDISEKTNNHKIITEKKEKEFNITISNITNSDKVEKDLKKMINDFNEYVRPIIFENILSSTKIIKNVDKIAKDESNSDLSTLIKIREEIIMNYKDQEFEIFDLSINKETIEISNSRILIISLLISLSLFLMFIIIKR
jgi:hypothetical protein